MIYSIGFAEGYCQGAQRAERRVYISRFILDGVYIAYPDPGPTYGIQRLCMGFSEVVQTYAI